MYSQDIYTKSVQRKGIFILIQIQNSEWEEARGERTVDGGWRNRHRNATGKRQQSAILVRYSAVSERCGGHGPGVFHLELRNSGSF